MRDIGVDAKPPERECDDRNCPWHGNLKVRGQILEGIVISDRMDKTVIVEREYLRYDKKYERYEKRKKRYHVHNPPCIDAKKGDRVRFMESRPLSKTVSFVIIEKR